MTLARASVIETDHRLSEVGENELLRTFIQLSRSEEYTYGISDEPELVFVLFREE